MIDKWVIVWRARDNSLGHRQEFENVLAFRESLSHLDFPPEELEQVVEENCISLIALFPSTHLSFL